MIQLIAAMHTLGARMQNSLDHARTTMRDNREEGSVSIESVVWAVAVIVIAGIAVAAITAYVRSKSGDIK
ncbi:hypothetical protein [Flexivirga oryzae]|uniref:Heme/copper-type cytochrome/quinol oxidase subunit 2 n=1 Tax=Flexivirga oryzae TaxID=1794944 RepID=A0A839N943_9MICO|nr:hypothetical protein [Flexivirga oryzae]MBB2892166.1 heme/copper-type cytochrome/quinol oxidase subunit 2 [Flexivirga oryzae]